MGTTHPEPGTVSLARLPPSPGSCCPALAPTAPSAFIGVADLGFCVVSVTQSFQPGRGDWAEAERKQDFKPDFKPEL